MCAAVVIASNRGPLAFHRAADGSLVAARGGGGLVSAMAGLVRDDPQALWVCAALGEVDREVAASAPGGRLDRAGHGEAGAVAMLAIDTATLDAAYNRVANATLWFVHHEMPQPVAFDAAWRADWSSYVAYNDAFADAIAMAARPGARVLAQDYHLALLPAMLRARRRDLRIAHFTHTPWASPPAFANLPDDVGRALLEGMLGADSLGFHSPRWARAFAACCEAVLGAELAGEDVTVGGRTTRLRVHPLGVDADPLRARAGQPDVAARRHELRALVGGRRVVARVDRTEPSKNIVRGLLAFRDLLVRHPEHREHVVHLALAYPSRQDVAAYRDYTQLCRATADAINGELSVGSWTPILLDVRDDYARSLATMQVADVMLVNPVRDGMNLVAKEAALLGDAVLVLSTQAGAADEMAGAALLVDPYDVTATADALHTALTMPAADRARRHADLVRAATALPPGAWLAQQLAEI